MKKITPTLIVSLITITPFCQTYDALIIKGDSLLEMGDFHGASFIYTAAIETDSSKYVGYWNRGKAHFL